MKRTLIVFLSIVSFIVTVSCAGNSSSNAKGKKQNIYDVMRTNYTYTVVSKNLDKDTLYDKINTFELDTISNKSGNKKHGKNEYSDDYSYTFLFSLPYSNNIQYGDLTFYISSYISDVHTEINFENYRNEKPLLSFNRTAWTGEPDYTLPKIEDSEEAATICYTEYTNFCAALERYLNGTNK